MLTDRSPSRSLEIRLRRVRIGTVNGTSAARGLTLAELRARIPNFEKRAGLTASVETLRVRDYDEPARRVRLRAATTKTRKALWVELPDVLADAIEATLPPREDRDPETRIFPGTGADRLRTAVARACRAAGIPPFSPHDLRHQSAHFTSRAGRGRRPASSSASASSASRATSTRTS